jgi:hypothetical protein
MSKQFVVKVASDDEDSETDCPCASQELSQLYLDIATNSFMDLGDVGETCYLTITRVGDTEE